MIRAVLFDLDGTLVQTEELKARSYAAAAAELDPGVAESAVVDAFDQLAGRSRQEVAEGLVARFGLAAAARARAEGLGVGTAWEAFVALRLRRYDAMLADGDLLRAQRLPAAIALLQQVRVEGYRVGLTTMSDCAHATRILAALDLTAAFEVIITPDDVSAGKPAPDMYLAACARLGVAPGECIALEDSVAGVQAAVTAGVACIAVPTWLTAAAVRRAGLVDDCWIVDDPGRLAAVFAERVAAA